MYSNGSSEVILGKAIKQFQLPRDEIVIMTKVVSAPHSLISSNISQLYFPVEREPNTEIPGGQNPDNHGDVNQKGLSRKVISFFRLKI